jgi:cell division protein ZapA
MSKMTTLDFSVLGRDFSVACPENERDNLLAAANYLDAKMQEIQKSGKVVGQDRIAIMAALNIAYELLTSQPGDTHSISAKQKVRDLQNKVDQAIAEQNQLFPTD